MSRVKPVIRESNYLSDLPQVAALFQEYAESIKIDLAFQGFAQELTSLPGYYGHPHSGDHGAVIDVVTDFHVEVFTHIDGWPKPDSRRG